MKLTICARCGKSYEYDRQKGHRKTICSNCNISKHRQDKKKWAIELKGGACMICGYNKCIAALSFHHRDGKEKDFGFGGSTGWCRSYKRIEKELDKCDLLCCNCHMELHHC